VRLIVNNEFFYTHIRRPSRRDGFAVIMVVIVLVALVVVAAPFLVSMKIHESTTRRALAQTQARMAARGARNHAMAALYRTHLANERDNPVPPFNTPYYDHAEELYVPAYPFFVPGIQEKTRSPFAYPHGVTASTVVADEQGKINLNTTPPLLFGSLLSATELTRSVGSGETRIRVTSTESFPKGDRRGKIAGYLWINGELIAYRRVTHELFMDCIRGYKGTRAKAHTKGQVAVDGRGFFVQSLRLANGGEVLGSTAALRALSMLGDEAASLSQDEYERILPLVTVHSYLPPAKRWGRPTQVRGPFPLKGQTAIQVKDAELFALGSIVRVTAGSAVCEYRTVLAIDKKQVILDEALTQDFPKEHVNIQPEARHPVNLNTVRPEVLRALFTGLSLQKDIVTPKEAAQIAGRLFENRPIKSMDGIWSRISGLVSAGLISRDDLAAVVENGYANYGQGMQAASVPYCLRTFDVYTVLSSSVVSSSAGIPLSRYNLKEIISVVPPDPREWRFLSQKDFHEEIRDGRSRKVTTGPVPMFSGKRDPDASHKTGIGDARLATLEDPPTPHTTFIAHFNDLAKRASLDASAPAKGKKSWQGTINPNLAMDPEGVIINPGDTLFYSTDKNISISKNGLDPGSLAMWFLPGAWGSGAYCLFDTGEAEYTNRIALYYDGSTKELIFLVADPTLPEVDPAGEDEDLTYPWTFEHLRLPLGKIKAFDFNAWHHVAVGWIGGVYQRKGLDLVMYLDGMKVTQDVSSDRAFSMWMDDFERNPHTQPLTYLSQVIEKDEDEIPVEDTSAFPAKGVIWLEGEEGIEIIRYEERTDKSFSSLLRRQRGTRKLDFEKGTPVRLYGYTVNMMSYLLPADAETSSDLGTARETTINVPPTRSNPQGGIDASQTDIPVANAADFQDSGFVAINKKEVVYYASKTADLLSGCVRGELGTQAVFHAHQAQVQFISLEVDSTDDYRFFNDPVPDDVLKDFPDIQLGFPQGDKWHFGIVQVDSEWALFKYKEERNGKYYLVGRDNMWNIGQTFMQAHDSNTPVLPVFMVDQAGPGGPDIVTVTDDQDYEALRRIKHSGTISQNRFAAFDEQTTKIFGPHTRTRILKFPSGTLPRKLPEYMHIGNNSLTNNTDKPGQQAASAVLDEVHIQGFCASRIFDFFVEDSENDMIVVSDVREWPESGFLTLEGQVVDYSVLTVRPDDEGISTIADINQNKYFSGGIGIMETTIELESVSDFDPSGFVLIDDEIVQYASIEGHELRGCSRGIVNTIPAPHPSGTQVRLISGQVHLSPKGILEDAALEDTSSGRGYRGTVLPQAVLDGQLDVGADEIFARGISAFPLQGYLKVGYEIIGYEGISKDGFLNILNQRGRYGTRSDKHGAGALVRWMPTRYPDLYARNEAAGSAFFHASKVLSDTHWQRIKWDGKLPDGQPLWSDLEIEVLVRFDGTPEWDTPPTNTQGGIFRFTQGDAENTLDVTGDEIEVRVFFRYEDGAYENGSSWLYTPVIDSLSVEYGGKSTIYLSEEEIF